MQIIIDLSGYQSDRNLPAAVVVGARGSCVILDTAGMGELAGICFEPSGFASLFRERADAFFERSVPLADLWSDSRLAERLAEEATPSGKLRMLELLLARRISPRSRPSELVEHALHFLQGDTVKVAECARSAGVSERRLLKVFREEVGMPPKTWARIGRFQAAVQALHEGADVAWADLALRCGYYDQSHFANDFRAFSGISPSEYAGRCGPWQNHVRFP